MTTAADRCRGASFGQEYSPTWVDRFGIWLSARRIRKHVPDFTDKRVGDFGCGFHASFARTILGEARQAVLIDVALSEELKRHPKVVAIEGSLPESLRGIESDSLDVILCISVLEHLWNPLTALREFNRLLAPDGVCLVNVPSWRGKAFLELAAFRLGWNTAPEIDDHKMYYEVRDLWPLLVQAGFFPHAIRCFPHKFGLNTFAICRASTPRRAPGFPND